jgi:NAD(P)-dependent dehydrogenase (short-subunit alcohol dehydrogenase family)
MAGYIAPKHAVVGLTRAGALDAAPYGIRVNTLCPGVTETPTPSYVDMVPAEEKAKIYASIPRGKIATCEEMASTSFVYAPILRRTSMTKFSSATAALPSEKNRAMEKRQWQGSRPVA